MAGIFKTIGSGLSAIDTVTASGARRLAVWGAEQETKTKWRSAAALTRIKREAAEELAIELRAMKSASQDPEFTAAFAFLESMDSAKEE